MQPVPENKEKELPRSPKQDTRSMPPPGNPQSSIISIFLNLAHNLTQLMLGGVIISGLVVQNKASMTITTQHIPICILGYFLLMTQGILVCSPFGWATQLNQKYKLIIHYVMEILGSIAVITSSALVMANVNNNFATRHGSCGIIAMILTVLTLVELIPGLIFSKVLHKKLLSIHAYIGAATLCFAFMSLIFALNNYYRELEGNSNANTAIMLTVFSLIGTLLMALIKRFQGFYKK